MKRKKEEKCDFASLLSRYINYLQFINHSIYRYHISISFKMKVAFILLVTLVCNFQSLVPVSGLGLEYDTLSEELNKELASIIKDDLAQGLFINY